MSGYKYTEAGANTAALWDEIIAAIPPTPNLVSICDTLAPPDNLEINFDDDLSGAQKTTLDGVVAAHVPPAPKPVNVYGENFASTEKITSASTTSTSYQTRHTHRRTGLPAGTYRVDWECRYSGNNTSGRYRLYDNIAGSVDGRRLTTLADPDDSAQMPLGRFEEIVVDSSGVLDVSVDYKSRTAGVDVTISVVRVSSYRVL